MDGGCALFQLNKGMKRVSESRIRWSPGTSGEPEGPLSNCGYDGSRSNDHHEGEVGQQRIPREHHARSEVLCSLQTVRRAALETGRRQLFNTQKVHLFPGASIPLS